MKSERFKVLLVDNDVLEKKKSQYKAPGDASVDVVGNAVEGCGKDGVGCSGKDFDKEPPDAGKVDQ